MMFGFGVLVESAKRFHQAFTWGYTEPPEETFVDKVEQRKCWRTGCHQAEYSETGLCMNHIREMQGWR